MQLEAIGRAIKFKLHSGVEILLEPGRPVELPDASARSLLKQAGAMVRIVSDTPAVVIEPASPTARLVYWERNDGRIYGPAIPEFLAHVGLGLKTTNFWVVTDCETQLVWIRSDRLRSRQQFEAQQPMRVVAFVKEPR